MNSLRGSKAETKNQSSGSQQKQYHLTSENEDLLAKDKIVELSGSGNKQQPNLRPESSLTNRNEEEKSDSRAAAEAEGSIKGKSLRGSRTSAIELEEESEALRLLEKSLSTRAATGRKLHHCIHRRCPSSTSRPSLNCCCSCSCNQQQPNTLSVANMSSGDSKRLVWAYFLAEMVGTFLLVVIGDGAIAAYVVKRRELDLFAVCLAFGVGAMAATFAAAKISGAHINPAASLAFALDGRLRWSLLPVYMSAQYLGAFLAALVLYVNYFEAISALDGGNRVAYGNSANSTGQIFATYPGQWTSEWGALLDQIIGTAILLFSLSALSDKNNSALEDRHQPIYVALIIGLTCVAFSPNCGAIFNPARDLGPRVFSSLVGYPSVWAPIQGRYWLTAGLVGPHIGAIIGVFAYKLLIGRSLDLKRSYELEALEMDNSYDEHKQQQQQLERQQQPYSAGKVSPIHHHHHQNNNTSAGNNLHRPIHGAQITLDSQQQHLQTNYGAAMR